MIQILTTMFFSAAALAALLMIWAILADNWADVVRALGAGARTSALPYNRHVRVNRAWRSRSSAMLPRPLRAAA